ncbi:hypothetical protein FIBSPDRAFT_944715 [Athelia psychrophila]|uniref:Small nuclear ribonucleoprotein Prp3 C-terminal domain-containing protein n=1 Tax=Athelia psychrophila TaxID=1759441 RepID=A0A166UFI7_9AGAM|nr:hypothetical protein FIBSPDRAFT_944715 [Fibularhizoctonia sp. CBS 109695]
MAEFLLEEQLSTIALLQAMYPLPSELVISSDTATFVDGSAAGPIAKFTPSALDLVLRLLVDDNEALPLELGISLPLVEADAERSRARLALVRQPDFLTRSAYETLAGSFPPSDPDVSSSEIVLSAIEHVRHEASSLLMQLLAESAAAASAKSALQDTGKTAKNNGKERLERVWFWFPSLSTKEKRRDLVEYAPRFGLTGFVLAGKPGLLCLEGDGRQVDRYMAAIKSESWGDIPSYQKKVTERLRNPLLSSASRQFTSMTEITHLIPQHGQHNHRGDMTEVKRLMEEWGVGDDFAAVINGKIIHTTL